MRTLTSNNGRVFTVGPLCCSSFLSKLQHKGIVPMALGLQLQKTRRTFFQSGVILVHKTGGYKSISFFFTFFMAVQSMSNIQ